MKKLLAMFALAVVMTGNAYATETNSGNDLMAATQIQASGLMSAVDMQAAFQQDAQPLQMAALSGQEMKETQGTLVLHILSNPKLLASAYQYYNPIFSTANMFRSATALLPKHPAPKPTGGGGKRGDLPAVPVVVANPVFIPPFVLPVIPPIPQPPQGNVSVGPLTPVF